MKELIEMGKTIGQSADEYEPTETLNIVDLDKVSVSEEIATKEYTKEDGEEFSIDVIEREGKEYRVPKSVVKQLKEHRKANPKLEFFRVTRSGQGMKTEYTVIPL